MPSSCGATPAPGARVRAAARRHSSSRAALSSCQLGIELHLRQQRVVTCSARRHQRQQRRGHRVHQSILGGALAVAGPTQRRSTIQRTATRRGSRNPLRQRTTAKLVQEVARQRTARKRYLPGSASVSVSGLGRRLDGRIARRLHRPFPRAPAPGDADRPAAPADWNGPRPRQRIALGVRLEPRRRPARAPAR